MGNAGTQDLRGVEVLPYALKIIGQPADPALAQAVGELRAWYTSGAHRINRERPGASGAYDQSDAVRIMDAWWPLLVKAEFEARARAGPARRDRGGFPDQRRARARDQRESPRLGLRRRVLRHRAEGPPLRAAPAGGRPAQPRLCGAGSLVRCRAALESSLLQAIGEPPQQVYPADGVCQAGDQMCSDSIQFRAIGAIAQPLIEWIIRPTFQQAVEIAAQAP